MLKVFCSGSQEVHRFFWVMLTVKISKQIRRLSWWPSSVLVRNVINLGGAVVGEWIETVHISGSYEIICSTWILQAITSHQLVTSGCQKPPMTSHVIF